MAVLRHPFQRLATYQSFTRNIILYAWFNPSPWIRFCVMQAIQDRHPAGRGVFSAANNQYRTPNESKHLFEQPGNDPYSSLSRSYPQFASAFQQLPGRGLQGANRFPGAYGNSGNALGNYSPYSSPPTMVSNRGLSGVGVGGYQPQLSYPDRDLYTSLQQVRDS